MVLRLRLSEMENILVFAIFTLPTCCGVRRLLTSYQKVVLRSLSTLNSSKRLEESGTSTIRLGRLCEVMSSTPLNELILVEQDRDN